MGFRSRSVTMQLPSIELTLIAGRAVFLVLSFILAAVAFTRWRRAAEQDTRELVAQNALLLDRLAGLEERMAATHSRIDHLIESVDSRIQRADDMPPTPQGYALAIHLARKGASRDEIVASCGITRQEADLVLRLHAAA